MITVAKSEPARCDGADLRRGVKGKEKILIGTRSKMLPFLICVDVFTGQKRGFRARHGRAGAPVIRGVPFAVFAFNPSSSPPPANCSSDLAASFPITSCTVVREQRNARKKGWEDLCAELA